MPKYTYNVVAGAALYAEKIKTVELALERLKRERTRCPENPLELERVLTPSH